MVPLTGLCCCRSLSGMHLGGWLSWDSTVWSSLSSLNLLDLSYNDLTGAVPPLEPLNSLQTLQLQGNKFTGSLPQLAGFSSLTTANFQENQFTGTQLCTCCGKPADIHMAIHICGTVYHCHSTALACKQPRKDCARMGFTAPMCNASKLAESSVEPSKSVLQVLFLTAGLVTLSCNLSFWSTTSSLAPCPQAGVSSSTW